MKVFFRHLALTLAPVLAAGVLAVGLMGLQRREALLERAQETARYELSVAAHLFESFLDKHRTISQAIASSPVAMIADRDPLLDYLRREEARLSETVEGLYWNQVDGVVFRTNGSTFNVSDRDYFDALQTGASETTGVLTSRASGEEIVLLLTPVRGSNGAPLGAIGLTLRVSTLLGEARRAAPPGVTPAIVDPAGVVITPDDSRLADVLDASIRFADGQAIRSPDDSGPSYAFSSELPALGWSLVHVYPEDRLLQEVRSVGASLALVLISAGLAGVLVAVIATIGISRPLAELVSAIRRYGEGDRAIRTTLPRRGEFRGIAQAFNTMADTIEQREQIAAAAVRARDRDRAMLDALLANTTAVVYVKDKQGRYLMVNDGHVQMLDSERSKIIGRTDRDLFEPAIAAALERNDADAMAQGVPVQFEERVTIRGRERAFLSTKFPVRDAHGEVIGLGVVSTDMTARDRAERALRDSERVYRTVTDFVPAGIFQADHEGRCIFVNKRWCELAALSPDDAMGDGWRRAVDPADRARIAAEWERCARDECDFRSEYRFRQPDGTQIDVEGSATAIRDADGRVTGYFGVVIDITEPKRLRQEVEHAHRMESIGRLAGGIAHDFNNLTTAILGYTDLARSEVKQGRDPAASLGAIGIAAGRAAELTAQLLAFARRRIAERRPFSLSDLLTELRTLAGRLLPENIEFVVDAEDGLWPVLADPAQIQQVLMNLVVNARDAMPEGGRLEVVARNAPGNMTERGGDFVRIDVSDTGVGVPAGMHDRIFEPFVTTKAPGAGTGLGLSTAHGIVTQAGGKILLESDEGEGARFTVLLPRSEEPVTKTTRPRPGNGSRGEECVLLVEDDERVLDVTRAGLRLLGYRVTAFARPLAALEAFRADPEAFDLMVTDMMMPEMTGDRLAREVRAIRRGFPIVLTSGYTEVDPSEIRNARTRYMQKPYTPEELAAKMRETLDDGEA